MKRIITSFLCWCAISLAFSQNNEFSRFVKRIENNLLMQSPNDYYNLDSKEDIERLFFGDFNAMVEFSYLPSSENAFNKPPSGFRIVKNTSNTSYILEVKYISNFEEAYKEASKKYPSISVTNPSSISNHIIEHNREAFAKQSEERLKFFKIETLSFPISNQLAEKLYKRSVLFISNFKGIGDPPWIIDGYRVTFRNVVDYEVWSLNIHMPKGEALKMTELFLQIVTDVKSNKMSESKYLSILNALNN